MIKRPRLKRFLTIYPLEDRSWVIRGGTDEMWRIGLRDERAVRTFGVLVSLLNGEHTVDDLLANAETLGVDRGASQALLGKLQEYHCLEEAEDQELTSEQARDFQDQVLFFSHFSELGGGASQAVLAKAQVGVLGTGPLFSALLAQLSSAGVGGLSAFVPPGRSSASNDLDSLPSGVEVAEYDPVRILGGNGPQPEALIVAQEAFDPPLMEALDAYSKRTLVPWLLVRSLSVQEGCVGPLFVPRETASYLSLEARLRGTMPFFSEHDALQKHLHGGAKAPSVGGGLRAFHQVLSGIAVTEIVKYLTRYELPVLAGRFLTVNAKTWETELHDVLRVPGLDHVQPEPPLPFPWKEALYGESDTHQRRA